MRMRLDAQTIARLRKMGPGVVLAAGILLALVRGAASLGAGQADRPATLSPVPTQATSTQKPQPQEALRAPLWFRVEADASRTSPADRAALCGLLDGMPVAGMPLPAINAPALQSLPDWYTWGRLASRRARAVAQLASSRPADRAVESALGVYAAHFPAGTTLCMVNRTGQEARVRVRVRLLQGIYRIERLTLSPVSTGAPSPQAAPAPGGAFPPGEPPSAINPRLLSSNAVSSPDGAQTGAPASGIMPGPAGISPMSARIARLGGRDLPGRGVVTNWVALAPGQICLLRYTDTGREAREAMFDALARLHALARSAPGPARQIRRILEEGESYLGGLYPGSSRNLSRRIGCIHRLLLLTAQARSLQRNDQALGAVPARSGKAAQQALDHLAETLAETSAALLGLVPDVTLTASETTPDLQARPASLNAQEETAPHLVTVTVALANTGLQSVSLVKLGMDSAALPSGVICRPADPAFFDTLPPGQTVKAVFHLRCPAQTTLTVRDCIGDVSYFMAGAPAHLRPHPW